MQMIQADKERVERQQVEEEGRQVQELKERCNRLGEEKEWMRR